MSAPAGCSLVADPRDACCKLVVCPPTQPPTTTGAPYTGPPTLSPNPTNPTSAPPLVPSAVPVVIQGQGVTPTPPATNSPNPYDIFTPAPPTQRKFNGFSHMI